MDLGKVLQYHRSVRYFDAEKELDTEKVKHCIEMATLAPTSSNMQLWEFYHITDSETMKKLSHACLDQRATETAKQMVVFVTRRDLHRKRAKAVLDSRNTILPVTARKSGRKPVGKSHKILQRRYAVYLQPFYLRARLVQKVARHKHQPFSPDGNQRFRKRYARGCPQNLRACSANVYDCYGK